MNNVRTKFDKHERYIAPAGSEYDNTYQEAINKKTGRLELTKTGETNTYERTQADLEGAKIENIIARLAKGDMTVFKEANLTYADAEDFPQNLMEAQNIVVKAKAEFENMPSEVREIFHNSPEEYVSMMGTEEFIEKLAPYNDSIAKHKKEEAQAAFDKEVNDYVTFKTAANEKMKGDNQ